MKFSFQATMLAFALAGTASAGTIQFTVTDIGGTNSVARAISANGLVVGESAFSAENIQAFLYHYSNGSMTPLGNIPFATGSRAWGVNSSGQVVGQTFAVGPGPSDPFRYDGGQMYDLAFASPFAGTAQAINDAGQIVGSFSTGPDGVPQHAFLYSNGQMNDLGITGGWQSVANAINAKGQIAGTNNFSWGAGDHAFLYDNGALTDLGTLPGFVNSYANGISPDGEVVGYVRNSIFDNVERAFLYRNGVMTDLGDLGGTSAYAQGINGLGQIVGGSYPAGVYIPHAFLYENGTMMDLNNLIDPASGWVLQEANAINDLGQIVGDGIDSRGDRQAFILTPIVSVPEPSSLVLLAIGAVAIGGLAVRRKRPLNWASHSDAALHSGRRS